LPRLAPKLGLELFELAIVLERVEKAGSVPIIHPKIAIPVILPIAAGFEDLRRLFIDIDDLSIRPTADHEGDGRGLKEETKGFDAFFKEVRPLLDDWVEDALFSLGALRPLFNERAELGDGVVDEQDKTVDGLASTIARHSHREITLGDADERFGESLRRLIEPSLPLPRLFNYPLDLLSDGVEEECERIVVPPIHAAWNSVRKIP